MRALAALLLLCAACPGTGGKAVGRPGGGKLATAGVADRKSYKVGDRTPAAEAAAPMDDERIPGLDRTETELTVALEPHLRRAREALAGRDVDGAIAGAQSALAVQGDHVEALRMLAQAYVAKNWLDKARAILDVATELPAGEKDAQLWMLLGLVHERGGAADQARRAYEEATTLKPNYAAAWTNLGALQLRAYQYQDAIASLETAQSIDGESIAAITNLGTAYRRRAAEPHAGKDRDELLRKAERSYRAAIVLDEDGLAAYVGLGLLYFDADPFPGLATAVRLQAAVRYLTEYKQRVAAAGGVAAVPVDTYLDAARHALDREQRRLEREQRGLAPPP